MLKKPGSLVVTLLFIFITAHAVVLFEIKNENGDPVFIVDSNGITIIGYDPLQTKALGDTLMTISASKVNVRVSDGTKGLSRTFSVSTNSSKAGNTSVMDVSTESTTMSRGSTGDDYTNFGPENIFLGLLSGNSISSVVGNTFMGNYSGTLNTQGGFNVFMGNNAGASNTTGNSNVFIGDAAGYSYSGSFGNVFIGQDAAKNLATGQRNVIIGYSAGSEPLNTQESYGNVFIGGVAGRKVSGDYNVMIGEGAGENYQDEGSLGYDNVFVGYMCGQHSTGHGNIYIGKNAGKGESTNLHTGSNNIYIGNDAGWADVTESNTFRLGHLLWGDLDGPMMLVVNGEDTDNPSGYTFYVNGEAGGDYAWNNLSDERLKKNIRTIEGGLDKVMKLRGVTYEWKDPEALEKGRRMGFIAQEAKDVIPEVVGYSEENDQYTMQYSTVTALLVEAVKELKKEFSAKIASIASVSVKLEDQNLKIEKLTKENEELKRKVRELEELRAEIDEIKSRLKTYASK